MSAKRLLLIAAVASILGLGGRVACADNDFIVYSPYVNQGQSEVEMYGFAYKDGRSNLNGTSGYNIAIAHAVTSWWKPELYIGEFNRYPGAATHLSGYEFENTFQLSTQGEFWADSGFLAAYAYNKQPGVPSIIEWGPLFEKKTGRVVQRLNLICENQIGGVKSGKNVFRSSYSISYKINTAFAPGIEAYYRPNDNAYQIGPALYGEFHLDAKSELEYSIGIIPGINLGAPNRTLLARLEYEFF
jgi:hypothetical protein